MGMSMQKCRVEAVEDAVQFGGCKLRWHESSYPYRFQATCIVTPIAYRHAFHKAKHGK